MANWIDKYKKKASDWFDRQDPNTKALLYPLIDLGEKARQILPRSVQEAAELYAPIYSDIKFGEGIAASGEQDIRNGNYISGAGKIAIAPLAAGAMLVMPNIADAAAKTSVKSSLKKNALKPNPSKGTLTSAEAKPTRRAYMINEDGTVTMLPEYAHPNTDPNLALDLTKDRIREGGNKRLKQSVLQSTPKEQATWEKMTPVTENRLTTLFYDGPTSVEELLIREPSSTISKSLGPMNPKELGGALPQYAYWQYTDAPSTPGTIIPAHEFSHYYHTPATLPPGINWDYLKSKATKEINPVKYFSNLNGGEFIARGTQLKNYFGLREGQNITPEMWEYAKQNYIKDTGLDNDMKTFFEAVDESKLPQFLSWLNKNAPSVAAVTAVGELAKKVYDKNNSLQTVQYKNGDKLKRLSTSIDKSKLHLIPNGSKSYIKYFKC